MTSPARLQHLTNIFWRALVLSHSPTHSLTTTSTSTSNPSDPHSLTHSLPTPSLESLLDCNCCVLDSFHDPLGTSLGTSLTTSLTHSLNPNTSTGIYITLTKLQEIATEIHTGNLHTAIHTLHVMQNHQQTRILIHSRGGIHVPLLTHSCGHVGIALNWLNDKITGIIIIKNANENSFFIDDTLLVSSPLVSSPLVSSPLVSSPLVSSLHAHNDGVKQCVSDEEEVLLLLPPYMCAKPPSIPATLSVTVLSCSNLKSRMKRVIARSVDVYVVVEVNGQVRRTEVVADSNPWFSVDNSFFFQLPEVFLRSGPDIAVARFRIMDKVTFGEDQELSTAVLPLASLRGQVNNDNPSDITLPLILHNKVGLLGFEYSQNAVDDEVPLLKVRVSKVDVQEWWQREERRLREEANEHEKTQSALVKKHRIRNGSVSDTRKELREDTCSGIDKGDSTSKRKGSWTSRLSASVSVSSRPSLVDHSGISVQQQQQGSDEVDVRPVMSLASKSDWVDSKHVVICMGCLINFTMTNRKHHCRSCGEVFCKNCSSGKAKLGSSNVRVCDRCRTTKRVSAAVLHLERDSVISLGERCSEEYMYSDDEY